MKIKVLRATAMISLFVFGATGALANEANYQQYVIGDRAGGMGGAGAALGTALDASYYNPAGLAFTKQRTISVSASLYGWQRYQADNALFPSEDLETSTFVTVPPAMGLVCFAQTNLAVSFAAFVPSRFQLSDIIAFPKDKNFYNASIDDQTLLVGPAAAYKLSPEWSFGLGAYAVYRNFNSLQSVYLNNLSYNGTRSLKYKTFAALLQAGAQYRPTENWRLGFSAEAPSLALWGNGEFEGNESLFVGDAVNSDGVFVKNFAHADNMDAQYRIPAKFTLGAGWEKEKSWGLAVDVSWHLANSYNRLSGKDDTTGEPLISRYVNRGVVDFNAGAEYYIVHTYPIRAGFYTSRTAAPDIDLSQQDLPAPINEYGLVASVGREVENIIMSLGVNYVFGRGDEYGFRVDQNGNVDQAVTTANERQIYILFNTSYMF